MSLKTKKLIVASLCILFTIVFAVIYLPEAVNSLRSPDVSKIDNWYYFDENGFRKDLTLPEKLYRDKNGDITLKTVLPGNFPRGQTLCFWTFYQSVDVYIGKNKVYSYNNSPDSSFGEAASSQWNFVDMPDTNVGGEILTLKMNTPYTDINLRLSEVVYGKSTSVLEWLHKTYDVYLLLELFFIAVGIFMIAMVFFIKLPKKIKMGQLFSGLVFIVFSAYLKMGTKNLPVHLISNYTRELMYFASLLFLAVPFSLYIRTRVSEDKKMVRWCDFLVALDMVIGVFGFVMHGLGMLDLHRITSLCCIPLFMAAASAVVFCIIYIVKKKRRIVFASLVSSLIIMIGFIFEYIQFYQLSTLPFDTGLLSHIAALIVIFIETSTQLVLIRNEIKAKHEIESENRSLQLQLLTDQIRPHFLLNTVGAIRTLIYDDPDKASDLLYEFSRYFRKNFEQKDYNKPIPFPQELDYIATYLKLEKARLGDKITVNYDIQEREFWVLPLTVQPFIENAVKHGVFPADYPGVITISTRKLIGETLLEITDNGVGMDVAELNRVLETKNSVGIRSARMRLNEQLSAKIDIQSSMEPGKSGTTVKIVIPDRKRSRNENNNR
jgi:anti-sigma regulatory factor (Ser/Thr protein kinase)